MDVHVRQVNAGFENEPYMSKNQLAYFKNKLIRQKMELLEKINKTKDTIRSRRFTQADVVDRSNSMLALEQEIMKQDRYRARIKQIDAALSRIENGSFGYCRITGNEIGLKRLEILPFTAIAIEAIANTQTH